jgi:hypothetical protein
MALTLVTPVCLVALLYLLINSSMGDRIATHLSWDDSADSRRIAIAALNFMKPTELIFGVSSERLVEIAYRMNLTLPLSDIENPWLLMFMSMGFIAFPPWLAATLAFVYKLIIRQKLALQLAVLSYFIIASTSNSFGRKDSTYLIMVSTVICASRILWFAETSKERPLPAPQRGQVRQERES